MALRVLRPTAIGFYDAWVLAAGATKVIAVDTGDPVAHDDAATYISEGAVVRQSFTVTGTWPPNIGLVNAFTVGMRIIGAAPADQVTSFTRLAGVNADVGAGTPGAVWTTYGPTAAPRPGGGAWTSADGAVELGVNVTGLVGGAFVTSLWGVLDYSPTGGGFVFLLGSLIGPLLGSALLLQDVPRIITDFNRAAAGRDRIEMSEAPRVWADLKADVHRRYSWLR